jgi:Fe-S-cluster containining protein
MKESSLQRNEIAFPKHLATQINAERMSVASRAMAELISNDFEPFFCGNAAFHLLVHCSRCGRCCKEERTIAVSIEDCGRIARHRGKSRKKFIAEFTTPHELSASRVGNARMLKKAEGHPCPFYDPDLPGCSIHEVKPQVCSAAFYLSKMNLLLCRENKCLSVFPSCPADIELREQLLAWKSGLEKNTIGFQLSNETDGSSIDMDRYLILLRLKGMEIYYGKETATRLARRIGLPKTPSDDEIRPIARLFILQLLMADDAERMLQMRALK